ncbi:MAG: aminotransferase class IV [Planctomycetota bacterium]|nr:aminotransferase class IV [Planctomycetota bacterium]MDA1251273.1 aminotransferase class IV [Planctomycetota bacterium]
MPDPVAWLNGKLIDAAQAAVPVGDLGVVAGASVTEFLRTFQHEPYRLAEHLLRLMTSLDLLEFGTQVDESTLRDAVEAVVTHNHGLIPPHHELGLIAFVTAGQNLTYLGEAGRGQVSQGTVCVHSFPLPFELWAHRYTKGQHLATVSVPPLPGSAVDPRAKHRNRLHWLRADREARAKHDGSSSILATTDGLLTETSSGNVFVLNGNRLRTPREGSVLCGISRTTLIEIAEKLDMTVEEADLTAEDLAVADEVLTTSTPYCVIPVTHFNGQPIGNGEPGPSFQRLIAAWSHSVGVDIVRQAEQCAAERK